MRAVDVQRWEKKKTLADYELSARGLIDRWEREGEMYIYIYIYNITKFYETFVSVN